MRGETGARARRERDTRRALAAIEEIGLLVGHDRALRSVSSLVAGEPIPGSWWSHPRANDIYWVYQGLEHDPDVLRTKLVGGKITFVHRRLWLPLYAVATGREAWQRRGLSAEGRALARRVESAGRLRTDEIPRRPGSHARRIGDVAREIEGRLLVFADEIHTESGAHAKVLETWARWRRRAGLRGRKPSAEAGRRALTEAAARLGPDGSVRLPWSPRPR